jgi:hypothetical protein
MISSFFENRKCGIATKHQKERVIGPALTQAFGLSIIPLSLDTDLFGTFCGDIPRLLAPVETLRAKCDAAARDSGLTLIVASEGSFGPHPILHFIPADEEFIILKDYDNDFEVIARVISTDTNFDSLEIRSEVELLSFAQKIGFPSHALILRCRSSNDFLFKGICDQQQLLFAFNQLRELGEGIVAETDMRAMNNPTRMRVIESCCHELIKKIQRVCPKCGTPGFDVTDVQIGLPCEQCGSPTRSALIQFVKCKKCEFQVENRYPSGKESENPMYCDICNP